MIRDAEISDCENYRYRLTREWGASTSMITFIGLNPSTADGDVDDPTMRRLIGFAKSFGFDNLEMLNLLAYRCTDPKSIPRFEGKRHLTYGEIVGPLQVNYLGGAKGQKIVACWGATTGVPNFGWQREWVQNIYKNELWCFGTTKAGHPKHPLYLKGTTQLEPYAREVVI